MCSEAGDPVDFKVETSEKGTVATEVTVKVPPEEAGVGLLDVNYAQLMRLLALCSGNLLW